MENEYKILLDAVNKGSKAWRDAFNSGNATVCANQYTTDAVMTAKPFGTYSGTTDIKLFWEKLIADGYCDVEYIDTKVEIIDEKSVVLSAKWRMNKASGVITKELWILEDDGKAKLKQDHFEAQG